VSQLAVGAGSLWAINPAGTVSRFDAETGEPEATIRVEATSVGGIAYGEGGLWVVGEGPSVTRIDPTTNRREQPIPVPATGLAGIAAGAGSVWASAPEEGVVWRIEPGAEPVARTIEVSVGRGVVAIAFGEGALWAANYADGTIARIDPATNEVTRTRMPGSLQGIAAGAGSAWVSVVGGTTAGPLSTAACRPLESGGQSPDVLIVSDVPLQGEQAQQASPTVDAIRFVLRRHGFRAGRYAVGYHSCDDATAQAESWSDVKCMANAKAYGAAEQVVGIIGPYNSGCAGWELPITNRAPSGPLPVISSSNTYAGLTRESRSNLRPDEPESLYPTGVRHYFRVVADDEVQGVAGALLARRLRLKRVYFLDTLPGHPYTRMLKVGFETAAHRLGLRLARARSWEPGATSYAALADRVARARPDGVFLAGIPVLGEGDVMEALRDRLGADVVLLASDAFSDPLFLPSVGSAAEGMYVQLTQGFRSTVSGRRGSDWCANSPPLSLEAPHSPTFRKPSRRSRCSSRRSPAPTARAGKCSISYAKHVSRTASSAASASTRIRSALVGLRLAEGGGEPRRGFRVGWIEGQDREFGKREVASGSERGEGAEEREVGVVEAELVHEYDVLCGRRLCAAHCRADARIREDFLVKGFEIRIVRRLDLAAQLRKQVAAPVGQISSPRCQTLRMQADPERVPRRR